MWSIGVAAILALGWLSPPTCARAQAVEAIASELPPVPQPPVGEEPPSARLEDAPGRPVLEALVAIGAWGGLYFTAGFGALAALFACGDGLFSVDDDCSDPITYSLVAIGGAIGLVGVPVAVWGVGHGLDGAGGLGWTMLGHLIGTLIWGFLPIAAAGGVEGSALTGIGIFAGVAQITGAVVAYELSSSDNAATTD
jgi:hypothetical protein